MRKVEDAMNRRIRKISKGATLAEAAQLMKKFRIGSLVVVDNSNVVGIITERDLAFKIVAGERSPSEKVASAMSEDLVFVSREGSLRHAARKMAAHGIKRLLVGSREKIEGIITITDIVTLERIGEDPRIYSYT